MQTEENQNPAKEETPNTQELTLRQQIFSGKQMLLERPPEMDYWVYKELLRIQSRIMKFLRNNPSNRTIQNLMR